MYIPIDIFNSLLFVIASFLVLFSADMLGVFTEKNWEEVDKFIFNIFLIFLGIGIVLGNYFLDKCYYFFKKV